MERSGRSSSASPSVCSSRRLRERIGATKAADVAASTNKQLEEIRSSVTQLQTSVNNLNTTTATQSTEIKNLQNDVNKLDTRVSNLGG